VPIPFITPFSRLAVLLLLAAVSSARGQSSADIDKAARIYGALPLAEDVRLSPDGNSLSLIAGLKGRRTLAIWHLDGGKPTLLTSGTVEPRWLAWKTSDRLLASVYFGEGPTCRICPA
jgi:hypothetical protein